MCQKCNDPSCFDYKYYYGFPDCACINELRTINRGERDAKLTFDFDRKNNLKPPERIPSIIPRKDKFEQLYENSYDDTMSKLRSTLPETKPKYESQIFLKKDSDEEDEFPKLGRFDPLKYR